jgi:hypothetical protein
VEDVILEYLFADLPADLLELGPESGLPAALARLEVLASSRSYAAMPHWKKQALMKFHSGWAR